MHTRAILYDRRRGTWLRATDPLHIMETRSAVEAPGVLREVEAAARNDGLHAVGFVCYEAAEAWGLSTHDGHPEGDGGAAAGDPLPLLWFALFGAEKVLEGPLPDPAGSSRVAEWTPGMDRGSFQRSFQRVHDYLADGHTYQVNLTFQMQGRLEGDPYALFCSMQRAQRGEYAAYIETEAFAVCSVSPELFFERRGGRVRMRPMKGTRKRGLFPAQDRALREELARSGKDRAENIMIVDMVRNDLGSVALPGTVRVQERCTVEPYPAVWQMTSTVEAESGAGLDALFAGTFPCASVTGAPKHRTMQIISELERVPRGLYTGAIGRISPEGDAVFSVAIRTAVVDRSSGQVRYGTGGGVVWESGEEAEYEEALTKAEVVRRHMPPFRLLETMRWTPRGGWFLLDRHLGRLAASADRFGFRFSDSALREALRIVASGATGPIRVRLLLGADGEHQILTDPLSLEGRTRPLRLRLAPAPVERTELFLYHKTTHRQMYERHPPGEGVDETLFYNEEREMTETTTGNLVVERGGVLLTPPVECGLLAGTLRGYLLDRGRIREGVIRLEDLAGCEEIWGINSVRGWRRARSV